MLVASIRRLQPFATNACAARSICLQQGIPVLPPERLLPSEAHRLLHGPLIQAQEEPTVAFMPPHLLLGVHHHIHTRAARWIRQNHKLSLFQARNPRDHRVAAHKSQNRCSHYRNCHIIDCFLLAPIKRPQPSLLPCNYFVRDRKLLRTNSGGPENPSNYVQIVCSCPPSFPHLIVRGCDRSLES